MFENSHNNKERAVGRRRKQQREEGGHSPLGKGTKSPSAGREGSRQLVPSTSGEPTGLGLGKGQQAGGQLGGNEPPLLGGRAGTCLDPSKPMGRM